MRQTLWPSSAASLKPRDPAEGVFPEQHPPSQSLKPAVASTQSTPQTDGKGWRRERSGRQKSGGEGQHGAAKELHKVPAKQLTPEIGEEITRTVPQLPAKGEDPTLSHCLRPGHIPVDDGSCCTHATIVQTPRSPAPLTARRDERLPPAAADKAAGRRAAASRRTKGPGAAPPRARPPVRTDRPAPTGGGAAWRGAAAPPRPAPPRPGRSRGRRVTQPPDGALPPPPPPPPPPAPSSPAAREAAQGCGLGPAPAETRPRIASVGDISRGKPRFPGRRRNPPVARRLLPAPAALSSPRWAGSPPPPFAPTRELVGSWAAAAAQVRS
ncbi:WAS/WASL-interacting protein family member 2-like [Accipiter gentilis]|uniref:WAS/WASL-interacting protein family member 2-like n=1 Tax=Astur gentilis TaxID=8957 RepID=UPI00210F68BB|nr:WAS/WASL-interacting protein family member 2-like [Accipiter gentilis]